MPELREKAEEFVREARIFLRWVLFACLTGALVGVVGVAFHYGIDFATELRGEHSWLIFLLPLAGMGIVLLYQVCGMEKDRGTNLVLVAVRDAEPMRLRTAPLIFVSTILTHLAGGSAGREGAALQLGGSLANYLGRLVRLDEKDSRVMVMCGMAAAFSALFGTPMTAAFFALELVSVGRMYYAAMVPCLVSAMVGLQVARLFHLHFGTAYLIGEVPLAWPVPMLQAVAMGILCALLSIVFCEAMHAAPKLYTRLFPNPVLRAAAGGLLVLGCTLLLGSQDFNGSGDALIRRMLSGEQIPAAFLIKLLMTALTLGAGFRGGEIVPLLCTGAAFGCAVGPCLGLSRSFSGSLAMACVFCGATNCPVSSILLAYELFGGRTLSLYALGVGVAYMLSGYYGLYSEQRIVYSKFRAEWIDKKIG